MKTFDLYITKNLSSVDVDKWLFYHYVTIEDISINDSNKAVFIVYWASFIKCYLFC